MKNFIKIILLQAGRLDIWNLKADHGNWLKEIMWSNLMCSNLIGGKKDFYLLFPFVMWHDSPTSGQEQLRNWPSSVHCVINLSCQCTLSFVKQRISCVEKPKKKKSNQWLNILSTLLNLKDWAWDVLANTTIKIMACDKLFPNRWWCFSLHLLMTGAYSKKLECNIFKSAPHAMDGDWIDKHTNDLMKLVYLSIYLYI